MLLVLLPAIHLCGGSASWTAVAGYLSVRLRRLLVPAVRWVSPLAAAVPLGLIVGTFGPPLWEAYNAALETYPLAAAMCTSGVGWFICSLLMVIPIASKGPQAFKQKVMMSLVMVTIGTIVHGPCNHYFYRWLDATTEVTDAVAIAAKVAIDQLLWLPAFLSVVITCVGLVSGQSFVAIGHGIKTDLFKQCRANWAFLPVVQAFNFTFLSPRHRVLVANGVTIATTAVAAAKEVYAG